MVRQGVIAFFACGLLACTTDVDDPANFTAGMSQGNGSSSGGATGNATEAATDTGMAENGNSATSTTGTVDGTGPATTSATAGGDCGNGVIDAGEQCDGADLQGFDCASLGLQGGTLACDPLMCTFDTSMCNSNPGTSG